MTSLAAALLVASACAAPQAVPAGARVIPLLLPDADTHTRLVLQQEAIEALSSVRGPVSVLSIVGAYRSGKSWLLNELSGRSCDDGFAVGHQRHAQTR